MNGSENPVPALILKIISFQFQFQNWFEKSEPVLVLV
jgi:hypothetical protein